MRNFSSIFDLAESQNDNWTDLRKDPMVKRRLVLRKNKLAIDKWGIDLEIFDLQGFQMDIDTGNSVGYSHYR